MIELLKKLRGTKKQTGADLRAALTEIDLLSLADELDAATRKREGLLLDGSDRQVLDAEAEIDRARIALDRGKAAKAELERRAVTAEVEEAKAALTAERDRVDAEAAALAADLRREWPKLHTAVIQFMQRIETSRGATHTVNEKLGAAGRGGERLEEPEWRARSRPEHQWERTVALDATVVLPAIEEWGLDGYNHMMGTAAMFLHSAPAADGRAAQSIPTPFVVTPPGGIINPRT